MNWNTWPLSISVKHIWKIKLSLISEQCNNSQFTDTIHSQYLKHWYLKVTSYINDKFSFFSFSKTIFISNYWYLKVNFLGPENLLWDTSNLGSTLTLRYGELTVYVPSIQMHLPTKHDFLLVEDSHEISSLIFSEKQWTRPVTGTG